MTFYDCDRIWNSRSFKGKRTEDCKFSDCEEGLIILCKWQLQTSTPDHGVMPQTHLHSPLRVHETGNMDHVKNRHGWYWYVSEVFSASSDASPLAEWAYRNSKTVSRMWRIITTPAATSIFYFGKGTERAVCVLLHLLDLSHHLLPLQDVVRIKPLTLCTNSEYNEPLLCETNPLKMISFFTSLLIKCRWWCLG